MFEETQICPYTGLRSFTEEESLYFKGREEHIDQATEQLHRNKFLMLTGASGDGKSSLVYAGIIPNARAGFLKAKYTQWYVADFRPERSPFRNLCKSLAKQLAIANADIVESELRHGFSALVDLYKSSKRFVDTDSVAWRTGSESERAAAKREAGNLIILIDQFEEFFTNPENYHRGVPSADSSLVLNLVLETARIALEADLPIYVVFTMRSDFIGQCAAFRSLPEYIGFSQFFVPRLNRSQLQQVIEEPAVLSGNKITRRLTERLIHDIAEGVDQLPILQHALNQIWHAASKGTEEMDLIHYAMVGGLLATELPEEQMMSFGKWFSQLPEKIKSYYHEPGLQNVLDTHANKLYESAGECCRQKGNTISDDLAKEIIRVTFSCLTKIDQSRAVRNRMTLKEIWRILNREDISIQALGLALDIFREPGNTFIRPFVTEEGESISLKEDDVLDITHESLIRNWELLELWAKEEFTNYTISLDFEQQLGRWVTNSKSSDYLLSIGPLTYFESWYRKVKPNVWWIARYLPEDAEEEAKHQNASVILSDSQEFLKRSARRHLVTRTVMRYGPRKIAAVIAIVSLLVFASFMTVDYFNRQNAAVLKEINKKAVALVANPDILLRNRVWLICEELKIGMTTVPSTVRGIADPIERINVCTGVATSLVYYGRNEPQKEILQSLSISDSLLNQFDPEKDNGQKTAAIVKEIDDLGKTLEMAYYDRPSPEIAAIRKNNSTRAARWAQAVLRKQPANFDAIADLNVALELAVNLKSFSQPEISELIQLMSPWEQGTGNWMATRYELSKVCQKGFFGYGFRFNGLYQELGYLYAAAGNAGKALQSVDSLIKHNQNYFGGDYTGNADNVCHIAACFYKYNQMQALDEFVKGYCDRKKIQEHEFYAYLVGRCKLYEIASTTVELDPRFGYNANLSLDFSEDDQLTFFFDKYRHALESVKDLNERNFLLALSYKDEGMIRERKLEIEDQDPELNKHAGLFDRAVELYQKVDSKFLEQEINVVELSGNDNITIARKFLFLFPDIRTPFHPNQPRLFHYFYTTSAFLKYIVDRKLVASFYPTEKEQFYLSIFFRDYGFIEANLAYQVSKAIDYKTLVRLEQDLPPLQEKTPNLSILYIMIAREAFTRDDTKQLIRCARKLRPEKIQALFLNSIDRTATFRQMGDAVSQIYRAKAYSLGDSIVKVFTSHVNRSLLYSYAAREMMRQGVAPNEVTFLIDSAKKETTRIRKGNTDQRNRFLVSYALAMQGGDQQIAEAYQEIKNEWAKFVGIQRICRSIGYRSHLFEAIDNIPRNLADADKAAFTVYVLNGYSEALQVYKSRKWEEYDFNLELPFTRPINYVDDKN